MAAIGKSTFPVEARYFAVARVGGSVVSGELFFLQVAHLCARQPQAQHSIVFRHLCAFMDWFFPFGCG